MTTKTGSSIELPKVKIKCQFGALLSSTEFVIHDLNIPNVLLTDTQQWILQIKNEELLLSIQGSDLQFVIPLNQVQETIYVSDFDQSTNVVLCCNVSIEVQDNPKDKKAR
ncbi:unnamed protein product [Didymodactylos carnosus]|uniref:Uncharacterized protein n=1 Tax=Didymodactylos carnosus TaxID=1234261 RepID=A0A815YXZ8_9BILA